MKEKLFELIDKTIEELFKIIIGITFGTVGTLLLTMVGINLSLPIMLGIIISMSTCIYSAITYIKKKSDEKEIRNLHQLYQLNKSMDEVFKHDNVGKVSRDTTLFISKINNHVKDSELSPECYDNINQFLYMINENYYDLITKKNPFISREKLIDCILTEIIKYMRTYYNQAEFEWEDVEEVLRPLFFIDDKIKKAIIKEFKASKQGIGKKHQYLIISKNVTEEMLNIDLIDDEPLTATDVLLGRLSIENYHTYEYIIHELGTHQPDELGDYSKLNWDIGFLKKVVTMMCHDFREAIIAEKGDLDEIELAVSFIHDAGLYGILNNHTCVSIEVIINAFKEWDYLSTPLKVQIVNLLFNDYGLPSELYPYIIIKDEKINKKVIPFPGKRNDK